MFHGFNLLFSVKDTDKEMCKEIAKAFQLGKLRGAELKIAKLKFALGGVLPM